MEGNVFTCEEIRLFQEISLVIKYDQVEMHMFAKGEKKSDTQPDKIPVIC